MLYRAKDTLRRSRFDANCFGIYKTPPVQTKESSVTVVTMLSRKDMTMYLVAIKSLCRFVEVGKIIVISDGSLGSGEAALLANHIQGLKVLEINEIETGRCPRGNMWERLCFIGELVRDSYVIQMDADTVALDTIEEVRNCAAKNRSFMLGTEPDQRICTAAEIYEKMKSETSEHIQVVAEKSLQKLTQNSFRKYARGCAGFAGFARNSFSLYEIESFSIAMSEIIGLRWLEWGSEQVASNYIISNSSGAAILPYPKYASFYSNIDLPYEQSSFLHFIGNDRFKDDIYMSKASGMISYLCDESRSLTEEEQLCAR